jgi:hypothetical protein
MQTAHQRPAQAASPPRVTLRLTIHLLQLCLSLLLFPNLLWLHQPCRNGCWQHAPAQLSCIL